MTAKAVTDSLLVILLFAAVMVFLRDYRARTREKRIQKITDRIR